MSNLELKGFKGLRSLNNLMTEVNADSSSNQSVKNLMTESLVPGKYQPRKQFNERALAELADSIKSQGIIQPLIVRKIIDDKYEIVAGERRWQAAKRIGLKEVPAIIREIDDNIALVLSLIENIQRQDLNPIEEAMAFHKFNEEFSMTHSDIAQMVGRARVTVTNTLRLLSLHSSVQEMLMKGKIDKGHALVLITLSQEEQLSLASKIVTENLTVRAVETIINSQKHISTVNKITNNLYAEKCIYWSAELAQLLASTVKVTLNKKGRGTITIQVDNSQKIDLILEKLKEK